MRRALSTPRTLLVLGLALVAGAGTGVAGHALAQPTRPPAPSSGVHPSTSPTTTPTASGLLGAGNVLASGDFTAVDWHDVVVEVLANGEPQFLYSCERRQLTDTGYPTATIDASWTRQHSLSAAETVAELVSPPQVESLFAALHQWYAQCTPGRQGTGKVTRTPSALLGTVRTTHGTAEIWRVGPPRQKRTVYAIVARDDYRLGLIDLYSDLTPPDPAGLRGLAKRAIDRLS